MKVTIEKLVIEGTAAEFKNVWRDGSLIVESENTPEIKTEASSIEEFKEVVEKMVKAPEETKPEVAPQAEPETAKEEAPAPETAKPKKVTLEDVREAMDKVRNKFEYGDPEPGQEKGPNEEMNAAIHKELTKLFKETAKSLGADKPSTLDEDKREDFINRINNFEKSDVTITPF